VIKVTVCLRVFNIFPTTTWWPYLFNAWRALGTSKLTSVSSYTLSISFILPHLLMALLYLEGYNQTLGCPVAHKWF
jgi:hypothetical protein